MKENTAIRIGKNILIKIVPIQNSKLKSVLFVYKDKFNVTIGVVSRFKNDCFYGIEFCYYPESHFFKLAKFGLSTYRPEKEV